jgi:hypothetical protein
MKTVEFLGNKGQSVFVSEGIYNAIQKKARVTAVYVTEEDNSVNIEYKSKRGRGKGYMQLYDVGPNGATLKERLKKVIK